MAISRPLQQLLLLFSLAIVHLIICTTAGTGPLAVVHIQVDLTSGSDPVTVQCNVTGRMPPLPFPPGTDFKYSPWKNETSVCQVVQTPKKRECSLTTFEPSRDVGQDYVYWSTREDGFYQSYDKSNWKKLADWQNLV